MNKQRQTFSFNPPIKLFEEGKCLLGVTSFDCANSVFNLYDGKNSFSIIIPGHWENKPAKKTSDELNKLLEIRSLELHVNEVRKRGKKRKLGYNNYKISYFDTQKNEILK